VIIKRTLDTEMAQPQTPCEDKGRDWVDDFPNHGMAKMDSKSSDAVKCKA
jgi:hypothetical protein